MLIISFIIYFSVGSPVFFKQKRLRQKTKTFTIYKFRTMVKNAQLIRKKYQKLNQAPAPMFKIDNDPRFVGIGKFLSRTGLDELPQLINIIKGEMSFVGPRPLPVTEARKLSKAWQFRYQVKPGIFSFWANSPERNQSLSKWKSLEIETLKQGGLRFELSLMVKVVKQQLRVLI